MLRVTRLTDYATLILATLARQPARVHAAAELAEQARLELPTVAKVLKPLARAGLVESFRGASGGYRLARPAAQIALIDVVEAIEGKLGMTECSGDHSNCELESHCGVAGQWRYVNDIIASALRSVSLAEMMQQPKRIPLQLAGA
ncbi:MAG TPA: SUF system Fe-S cluster assembly regulator [Arenimonas sp.]|nr:SUF system Fe-S cluster assembly regulator [Arenimonas sp.]